MRWSLVLVRHGFPTVRASFVLATFARPGSCLQTPLSLRLTLFSDGSLLLPLTVFTPEAPVSTNVTSSMSHCKAGRVPSGPETVNGTRCNAGKSAVSMLTPAAPL
jgi:hypothetical protein